MTSLPFPRDASHELFAEAARAVATDALTTATRGSPASDVRAHLLAWRPQDERIVIMPLPASWFASSADKIALGTDVITPLAIAGADRLAVISMTWSVDSDSPAGKEVKRLADAGKPIPWLDQLGLDGVRENLVVLVMDRDRDHAVVWAAKVTRTRTNGRVVLGEWEPDENVESHWHDAARAGWQTRPPLRV